MDRIGASEYLCPDPPDVPLSEVLENSAAIAASSYQMAGGNSPRADLSDFLRAGFADGHHAGGGTTAQPGGSRGAGQVYGVCWQRTRVAVMIALAVCVRMAQHISWLQHVAQNFITPFVCIQLVVYCWQVLFVPADTSPGVLVALLAVLCGGATGGGRLATMLRQWQRYAAFVAAACADLAVYVFCTVATFALWPPTVHAIDAAPSTLSAEAVTTDTV